VCLLTGVRGNRLGLMDMFYLSPKRSQKHYHITPPSVGYSHVAIAGGGRCNSHARGEP
jgi:hypothetical protein